MARSATTEGDREEGTAGAPEQSVPATAAREEQLASALEDDAADAGREPGACDGEGERW